MEAAIAIFGSILLITVLLLGTVFIVVVAYHLLNHIRNEIKNGKDR